jgi:hypothetical protein
MMIKYFGGTLLGLFRGIQCRREIAPSSTKFSDHMSHNRIGSWRSELCFDSAVDR